MSPIDMASPNRVKWVFSYLSEMDGVEDSGEDGIRSSNSHQARAAETPAMAGYAETPLNNP